MPIENEVEVLEKSDSSECESNYTTSECESNYTEKPPEDTWEEIL